MAADATPEIDDHSVFFLADFALSHLSSTAVYFVENDLSIGGFTYI
jgi:hypothetical protein